MSQRTSLNAVVAVVLAVLAATLTLAYVASARVIDANRELLDSHERMEALQRVLSDVKDAETGQRGYLLTGDAKYLAPFTAGVANVRRALDDIDSRGFPHKNAATLRLIVINKLTELAATIDARRTRGLAAAIAVVNTDYGEHLMDAIRKLVAQMSASQEQTALAAFKRTNNLTEQRDVIFALVALINLAVLFWAYRTIRRETVRREAAALDTRRQKELLEVTLASIGDAVIITDTAARITSLNRVASQLTGWSAAEALNRPCAEVFNIINEDSRQPVDNPIAKVLREGTVVGLANHTLLIRKDGDELAIDDSGSPIKEADDAVRGAVLIFRDVTRQRDSERQLLLTNKALRAANEAKDQFLATLSHELRTPLSPVLAILTAWEAAGRMAPPRPDELRMLRRNIEQEARLIDDLLDLTRITRGKLSLNPELTDLHEVLNSVVETHQSSLNRKRQHVSRDLTAAIHHSFADPARLQQVFSNILSNAIKFTPYEGNIAVASRNEGDTVAIEISDNGIGMDANLLERLFRPFEQGATARSEQYGGLGLGMAIARNLVDAHHGTIEAQSPGPNQGSTFTVRLPGAEAPAVDAHEKTAFEIPPMNSRRSGSILVIEDHDDTADVMTRLLSSRGYNVSRCATLAQARAAIAADAFDLVLSDIGLPDGTGVELVRELRRSSAIPAIALTGYGSEQDAAQYHDAGFTTTVTKPINFQRLEALIDQLLPSHSAL